MMCKLKGRMDKGGHYDGNQRVDAKWRIHKLDDKGRHYNGQVAKGGIMCTIQMGGWIREGIMMLK